MPESQSLTSLWFDFSMNNPDKVRPIHTAIYLWQIELNERLKGLSKFASPPIETMCACAINNYKTYKTAFDELVKFGFIEVVQESKNQNQGLIIALVKNTKALTKAKNSVLVKNTKARSKNESVLVKNTKAKEVALVKNTKAVSLNNIISNNTDNTNNNINKNNSKELEAKKETEPTTKYWKSLVSAWTEFYRDHYGEQPTLKHVDLHALKQIVKLLKKRAEVKKIKWEQGQTEWTEQQAIDSLQLFLKQANTDKWLQNNFILANIYSQFDKIIVSAQNGKIDENNYNGMGMSEKQYKKIFGDD